MNYIKVTSENSETEHSCCDIFKNKDIKVYSKEAWMKERFDDGLVFPKSKKHAQNAPTPITNYALFYNGEHLTNEQMNDKRF